MELSQRRGVEAAVESLEELGPELGRPIVDTVKNSRHHNMNELRPIAVGHIGGLFAFDPRRHAILLIGGDKTGRWRAWYDEYVQVADDLYDDHLQSLEHEGLL